MKKAWFSAGVPVARQIYSALLYLYPTPFRREYAEELLLLFDDLQRDALSRGGIMYCRWWLTAVLDVLLSATHERVRTPMTQKSANLISLLLILPFLFLVTTATLNYEPPFAAAFTEADGYTPTLAGRIAMILLLGSIPAALLVNIFPRLQRKGSRNPSIATPFVPTATHILMGMGILTFVLLTLSRQLFHELRPFVAGWGSAAIVGQGLCLLAVAALPLAFLFNRLPHPMQVKAEGAVSSPAISISLIVGATILLVVIGVLAIFALEMTACSIGVPKCD